MKTIYSFCLISLFAINTWAQCTEINITIESNLNKGGPQILNWSVINNDTDVIMNTGIFTFNLENNLANASICLPDGCWKLNLESENILNN